MICEFTEPFPYYTQYTGIGENRVRDTLSSLKKIQEARERHWFKTVSGYQGKHVSARVIQCSGGSGRITVHIRNIGYQKEKAVDEGKGGGSPIRRIGRYRRGRRVLICGFEW